MPSRRLQPCLACGNQYQVLTGHECSALAGELVTFEPTEPIAEDTPIVLTERACLRCDKPFMSEGNHNRLCNYCGQLSFPEEYHLEKRHYEIH